MNKKEKIRFWEKELQARAPDLKPKRREQLLHELSRILPGKPRSESAVGRELSARLKALEQIANRAPDVGSWNSADITDKTIISRAAIEAFLFAQDYTGESGVSSIIEQLETLGIPVHGKDGHRDWKGSMATEYAILCDPTAYTNDGWSSWALKETTGRNRKKIYTLDDGYLTPTKGIKARKSFAIPDTAAIFQEVSFAAADKETISKVQADYKASKAKSKASKATNSNAQRKREESDEEEEMASLREGVRRKDQPAKRNAEDGKDKDQPAKRNAEDGKDKDQPAKRNAGDGKDKVGSRVTAESPSHAGVTPLLPTSIEALSGGLLELGAKPAAELSSTAAARPEQRANSITSRRSQMPPPGDHGASRVQAKRPSDEPAPLDGFKRARLNHPTYENSGGPLEDLFQEAMSMPRRSTPRRTPHVTGQDIRSHPKPQGSDCGDEVNGFALEKRERKATSMASIQRKNEAFEQLRQDAAAAKQSRAEEIEQLKQALAEAETSEADLTKELSQLRNRTQDSLRNVLTQLEDERALSAENSTELEKKSREVSELKARNHQLQKKRESLLDAFAEFTTAMNNYGTDVEEESVISQRSTAILDSTEQDFDDADIKIVRKDRRRDLLDRDGYEYASRSPEQS
ncbi:hypothetical protein GE09DRAFT_1221004 [Coniochaeta sp. 2T2.1]|nr:hypothetical protein GE09DRAFT_1221004 [Coniochaeta sp. 2T2.1]